MMRWSLMVVAVALASLAAGCALTATVADTVNEQSLVTGVRLQSGTRLKVSNGGAVKLVPLKTIRKVTIHAFETMTLDRELYFLADVELRDGTTMASERAGWNVTFVCVSDVLEGTSGEAPVSLPLDKVTLIVFK